MKKPKKKKRTSGWVITGYALLCILLLSISIGLMCSFMNSYLTPVSGKPKTEQAE